MSDQNPSPRDLLMGMVDAKIAQRSRVEKTERDQRTKLTIEQQRVVAKAAKERGMSVSAFLRRSAIAFAAYDSGMDPMELLSVEPNTRIKGESPMKDTSRNGEGHGSWRIVGLR